VARASCPQANPKIGGRDILAPKPISIFHRVRRSRFTRHCSLTQSTMIPFKSLLTLAITYALSSASAAPGEWTPLFNGSDLSGWEQKGGKAEYTVENGEIVGTAVAKTPNSFLCTDREYADFILEFELKVDARLNSGVQFRSTYSESPTTYEWQGKTIKVAAKRFHGYQSEIDPDPKRNRMWTAGIYDEGRRGWLYPGALGGEAKTFTEAGRVVTKQNEWNKVRVVAVGNHISTFLNGVPRAAIIDDLTAKGLIGLQVHGIGNKELVGAEVRWRNIRIMEVVPGDGLSAEEIANGWAPLWDGKTTEGWKSPKSDTFPTKGWAIEDGVLSVLGKKGGDIVTNERYAAFELSVDFKMTEAANSGIKYFCQPNLNMKTGETAGANKGSAIGLEFQILDDKKHPDAKNGRDGNRTLGSVYDLITSDKSEINPTIGEWHTAVVKTDGRKAEHFLDGKLIASYNRFSPEFEALVAKSKYKNIPGFGQWPNGHLLLQDHGNYVSFRNIKIRVPSEK